ncbi:MAG: hypothetical protein JXB47_02165 [Anaerolineae bacterium]|nr:hypothetical protein [Anaerolineae bacterium]
MPIALLFRLFLSNPILTIASPDVQDDKDTAITFDTVGESFRIPIRGLPDGNLQIDAAINIGFEDPIGPNSRLELSTQNATYITFRARDDAAVYSDLSFRFWAPPDAAVSVGALLNVQASGAHYLLNITWSAGTGAYEQALYACDQLDSSLETCTPQDLPNPPTAAISPNAADEWVEVIVLLNELPAVPAGAPSGASSDFLPPQLPPGQVGLAVRADGGARTTVYFDDLVVQSAGGLVWDEDVKANTFHQSALLLLRLIQLREILSHEEIYCDLLNESSQEIDKSCEHARGDPFFMDINPCLTHLSEVLSEKNRTCPARTKILSNNFTEVCDKLLRVCQNLYITYSGGPFRALCP